MKIKIGPYQLENDLEAKCIPDGVEIFQKAADKNFISPNHFTDAVWKNISIIVQE